MKKFASVRVAAVAAASLLAFGCTDLAVELIDIAGEPDKIYHSGRDLLGGDYDVIGRPGSKYDESEQVSLRLDNKGWKISEDGKEGLHIYELTPEETAKLLSPYDQNTMQCAGTAKVTDFKFCTAPAGTVFHSGKIRQKMETGYIVSLDGDWNYAKKR